MALRRVFDAANSGQSPISCAIAFNALSVILGGAEYRYTPLGQTCRDALATGEVYQNDVFDDRLRAVALPFLQRARNAAGDETTGRAAVGQMRKLYMDQVVAPHVLANVTASP